MRNRKNAIHFIRANPILRFIYIVCRKQEMQEKKTFYYFSDQAY